MKLIDRVKKLIPFNEDEKGMMDVVEIVKALVMIIVVGGIGIFIADQVQTSVGTPTQANLSAMNTNILAAGQSGSSFIVILIIAFIGGIAISYLGLMYGTRGRRK